MEEKKERKTIKCSYAVLVIILFAALAFLTDYIIIDRKTKNCDCPKCEATNNEVISGDIENKDNTDNTQVTENQTHSYEDIVGIYYTNAVITGEGKEFDEDFDLILNDDYTFVYEFTFPSGHRIYGNYVIDGDTIILNYLYHQGMGDASIISVQHKNYLKINSDGSLVDSDNETAQYYNGEVFTLIRDTENKYTKKTFDSLNEFFERKGISEINRKMK